MGLGNTEGTFLYRRPADGGERGRGAGQAGGRPVRGDVAFGSGGGLRLKPGASASGRGLYFRPMAAQAAAYLSVQISSVV